MESLIALFLLCERDGCITCGHDKETMARACWTTDVVTGQIYVITREQCGDDSYDDMMHELRDSLAHVKFMIAQN